MEPIRILIVDDHPMVLEGMKALLSNMKNISVVGTATNGKEAIDQLGAQEIDVVILDINLPDLSGLDLTLTIKREFRKVQVLALSTFKEKSYVSKMIANGASGYLIKSASPHEIEAAIESVHAGHRYLSDAIANMDLTVDTEPEIPVVSRREKEVLQLIVDGLTNPQIAEKLFISLHTVDSHRKNLLAKFNVANTASLIRTAIKYRLANT